MGKGDIVFENTKKTLKSLDKLVKRNQGKLKPHTVQLFHDMYFAVTNFKNAFYADMEEMDTGRAPTAAVGTGRAPTAAVGAGRAPTAAVGAGRAPTAAVGAGHAPTTAVG